MATNVRRIVLAGASLLLSVGTLSACGFNAQTLQPYTPAQGVQTDQGGIGVRNLTIVADQSGSGFLNGAFTSSADDALVGVTGTALKSDGSRGGMVNATVSSPIEVKAGSLTNLVTQNAVAITGAHLKPGLSATVTLKFRRAGDITLVTPIIDKDSAMYRTVSPSAAPSS